MKKFLSLSLTLLFAALTLFSGNTVAKAEEVQGESSVAAKVGYLNDTYDMNIQVDKGAKADDIMNELNDLEQKLQMLEQVSNQSKIINVILDPTSVSNSTLYATTAYNVGFYSNSWDRYVEAEFDTIKYTKSISFNYEYYNWGSYNKFYSVSNISSDVTSIDDLLVLAGLRGWVQDGYDATFSNSDRTVTIKIYGHYQLGLNYDFLDIGVKEPFSDETWTLTVTLK